jgi:hypothetical protein
VTISESRVVDAAGLPIRHRSSVVLEICTSSSSPSLNEMIVFWCYWLLLYWMILDVNFIILSIHHDVRVLWRCSSRGCSLGVSLGRKFISSRPNTRFVSHEKSGLIGDQPGAPQDVVVCTCKFVSHILSFRNFLLCIDIHVGTRTADNGKTFPFHIMNFLQEGSFLGGLWRGQGFSQPVRPSVGRWRARIRKKGAGARNGLGSRSAPRSFGSHFHPPPRSAVLAVHQIAAPSIFPPSVSRVAI